MITLALWSFSAAATSIYAVKPSGAMLFYKHAGTDDGAASWPIQAQEIGSGWNFQHVFAGDDGAIYAIKPNGDMLFYKHTGTDDGSASWPIQAQKIGDGWNFQQVFSAH
ncbi:MAG TPA: tachylectin-related carbohydrate-binding protein [Lysobacter sp.]